MYNKKENYKLRVDRQRAWSLEQETELMEPKAEVLLNIRLSVMDQSPETNFQAHEHTPLNHFDLHSPPSLG